MCEWLSCAEWCDVKLVCGTRAFNAHRAVLASVSTFLRQILLSCPDETPTFIVLPEFDIDAMSAVLYYIYNGEVILPKQKVKMFMDIVTSLRIYIDGQYLSQASDANKISYQNNFHKVYKTTESSSAECYIRGPFINLRKGKHVLDSFNQYSESETDKKISDEDYGGRHILEKSRCLSGDRQSSASLRDSYIETYPQNGNVNGCAGGVLAISNEHYRGATSILTNANDKYPQMTSTCTSQLRTNFPTWNHVNTNSLREISFISNIAPSYMKTCNEPNFKLFYENVKRYYQDTESSLLSDVSSLNSKLAPIMQKTLDLKTSYNSKHTVDKILPIYQQCPSSLDGNYLRLKKMENIQMATSSSSKNVIFNQVLESPWCPRTPSNYKPFRRKTQNKQISSQEIKDVETPISSNDDNNNNVQTNLKDKSLNSKIETKTSSSAEIPTSAVNEHKCDVCDQVFTNSDCLTSHMRRHTTSRYTCTECSKGFSQLRNFKYHMSVHRGTKEFAATCPVCGKYFNDRGYLSSHMKIHRNRKEYKCPMCPKSFNQRVAYNMHVRIHTGVKPHVCGDCGKAFSRKMLLKQHQRTHSGERPYACSHCDKRFADRSNMTLHLRLHTGVKPFSCTLCPKSFTKKHHLKSHLNFHTGAKPYSCPRCDTAFTQSSNMRTHLKKCTVGTKTDDGDPNQSLPK